MAVQSYPEPIRLAARVLNSGPRVAPLTRARVAAVTRDIAYRHDPTARSLAVPSSLVERGSRELPPSTATTHPGDADTSGIARPHWPIDKGVEMTSSHTAHRGGAR